MAKVIKLTDKNNNTLLPITDASYIQLSYDGITKSVKDVILDNEEITAAALTELNTNVNLCVNEAGSGLTKEGRVIHHTNSITAQTFGPAANKTLNFGDTFTVPKLTVNNTGHIIAGQAITYTMPDVPENSHYQSYLYVTPSHLNSITSFSDLQDEFTDVCGPTEISGNAYTYISLYEGDDTELTRKSSVWVTGTGPTLVTGQISNYDTKLNINTIPSVIFGSSNNSASSSNYISVNVDHDGSAGLLKCVQDIPRGTLFYITFTDFEPESSNVRLGAISESPTDLCSIHDSIGANITDFTSPMLGYCPNSSVSNLYTFDYSSIDTHQLYCIYSSNPKLETNNIKDTFWVTFRDNNGNLTCSHTYSEITAAINANKKVFGCYSLTGSINQNLGNDRPIVLVCSWTGNPNFDTLVFSTIVKEDYDIISILISSNNVITINGKKFSLNDHSHTNISMGQGYGTTITDGSTATKVVTLSGYELKTGGIVSVYFANTHTASTLGLNINRKGAIPVYYNESMTNIGTGVINASDIATFIYNGNEYMFLGVNSGFHNGYGSCSTAGTTATTASITNYKLKVGGIVSIRFTNAVPASATLNVNGTGSKAIYYNNAAITANVIKAGDTATFMYDGTYYRLISIDKTAPLDSPTLTGTPTAPTATAGTNTTQIATTAFVTTAIDKNNLKYKIQNTATFTTSNKMYPNYVYIIGSRNSSTGLTSFPNISSITLVSNNVSCLATDIEMNWSSSQASNITNNMNVPVYQMIFKAGANGVSFAFPTSIKWKTGSAPDSRDTASHMCELTIINNIASIIIL